MSIWPKIEHGGYATQDLVTRTKVRVTSASYLPGVRTPMHVHPHHDQCIMVARGELKIISDKVEHRIVGGESIVITAGLAHSLESNGQGSKFISIFLGEGAELPGKTHLPEKLQKIIDPKRRKHEEIVETLLAPETVTGYDDFNEAERETLTWIINRLIKRIETGRVDTEQWQIGKTQKLRRAQKIEAWHKDRSLFLWSPGTHQLMSLTLKQNDGMRDYIKLSDIDLYRPSLKNLPQVRAI